MSLSKGIGYSELLTNTGKVKIYEGSKKLSEDIKFQLITPKGSILGNPEFGTDNLREVLFKYDSVVALDIINTRVYDLLSKFNVEVIDVHSIASEDEIVITYTIKAKDEELIRSDIIIDSEEVFNG